MIKQVEIGWEKYGYRKAKVLLSQLDDPTEGDCCLKKNNIISRLEKNKHIGHNGKT